MKFYLSFLAAAALAALPLSTAAAATDAPPPPPNDNFADAMVLTGQAVSSTPVTIDSATREGLERAGTLNQTVWYRWTAPQDGIVTITTAGTTYYNRLEVLNGDSLAGLVLIDSSTADTASLTFFVKAGLDYKLSIGAYNANVKGTAVLNINNKPTTITAPVVVAAPAGGNDNFANAVPLPGDTVSGFTYPLAASRESQEPSYTGNETVWWTWTAPADAEVTINTAGSSYYNVLTVFNGTGLTGLSRIRNNTADAASVSFPTKAGAVYYVCVGAYNSDAGTESVVNVTTAPLGITSPVVVGALPGAVNDNFANAQDLGNFANVSAFGYDGDATRETLERNGTGYQTLWWTWTAPADAEVTVTPKGSDLTPAMTVYNGDSLSTLAIVGYASGNDASLSFPAKAGFVYHVSIGDYNNNGAARSPVLNITTSPLAITSPVVVGSLAAANDDFAAAAPLGSSPVVSGFGYNYDAGVEQLESSSFGSKTLWWTWTAPADGVLSVDARGTDIAHVLTVGAGDTLTTLGPLSGVGSVASPAYSTQMVSANKVYRFAIGSRDAGVGGRLVLNLSFAPGIAHVTAAAVSKVVHVTQTNLAAFTVRRDGDLSQKLVINYKVKLAIGPRSQTLKGTQKFKVGKATARVNVRLNAYYDPYTSGYSTAILKLLVTPGLGYAGGDPSKAKVTLEK